MSNSDNTKKLYYKIGEVAEIFGVTTSLIRYYEKEFDIIKPRRNKKGNRLFTQNDIDNFHKIFHLIKEEGYTLEGTKAKLSSKRTSKAG
ncbi:MAG: MerR family transcriptional regulator, partial [Lentimicrobiaceae bacterium]|nr:MerR family transcriptional regulator [Lentimicrobiaceae bacterium]